MSRSITNSSGYRGIEFSFSEMKEEIQRLSDISSRFLENQSRDTLNKWKQSLDGLEHSQTNRSLRWEIPESSPIRTKPSKAYDRRATVPEIFGQLTAIWEIHVTGRQKGKKPHKNFFVDGLASTRVRIDDSSYNKCCQWTFEIGDAQSPGCHFHAGIGDHTLPIPRLPSIIVTPLDALDFLLGELFQQEWAKQLSGDDSPRFWRRCQTKRLRRLLTWKCEKYDGWIGLKRSKPSHDVFIRSPK